jgi:pentatricopeptide repeat protein
VLLAREVVASMRELGLRPSAHCFTTLLAEASKAGPSARNAAATSCLLRQLASSLDDAVEPSLLDEAAAMQRAVAAARGSWLGDDGAGAEDGGEAAAEAEAEEEAAAWEEAAARWEEQAPPPAFLQHVVGEMSPQLQPVFDVFAQMNASAIVPDRAAFNALINACAVAADVARAEAAFGAMIEAGIAPDEISYSSLIKACAAAGDAPGAERVFGEMQQRDNHFVKYTAPDSRSFHHLMTVQMERGDAGRVLELAAEMRARGVARTEGHYELALRAAAWHAELPNAVSRAIALYDEMRADGYRLTTAMLLDLDKLLSRHGRGDLARRLRRERVWQA